MVNKFEYYSNESKVEERESLQNEYIRRIEPDWWTGEEAICIFLGYAPSIAEDIGYFSQITSSYTGKQILKIVNAAIRDGSIKNHIIEQLYRT